MRKLFFSSLMLCCTLLACSSGNGEVFVETEFFDNPGGWTIDRQFYDQVGSAYLIAHGVGNPVQDATTEIKVPASGTYHVWARTFNWTAPFNDNSTDPALSAGRFVLTVNGEQLGGELGVSTTGWGWEKAGTVELPKGKAVLALHDLTGFDGRCDAILLSRDENPVFPERSAGVPAGAKVRRCRDTYDLIVVGAGTAGISAAVGASRLGLKALLLDEKDVLGGVSGEIGIGSSGARGGLYPELGRVISELGSPEKDREAYRQRVMGEKVDIRLATRVLSAVTENGRISSVVALDYTTGEYTEYRGHLFADCTGDANLAVYAGARVMQGPEARSEFGESLAPEVPDGRTYGSSMRWSSEEKASEVSFPECPWALQFDAKSRQKVLKSSWNWEVGFTKDQIKDAEWMRDYMLRVIYGNWDYLKNSEETSAEYACRELLPFSPVIGKRESRRIVGDYIFSQCDIYDDGHYEREGRWKDLPDAAVYAAYPVDQHFPDPENSKLFPGGEFLSQMKHNDNPLGVAKRYVTRGVNVNLPYMIPYRCFYSADIENMFMAGRDISGTRLAMASYRVMATTSYMGEVVAMAAKICREKGCTPRGVYENHLEELKKMMSEGIPARLPEIFTPVN